MIITLLKSIKLRLKYFNKLLTEKKTIQMVANRSTLRFRCASLITPLHTYFFLPFLFPSFLPHPHDSPPFFHYFLNHSSIFLPPSTTLSSFFIIRTLIFIGALRWRKRSANRADCVKNKWEDAIDIQLSSMSFVLFSFFFYWFAFYLFIFIFFIS